MSDDVQEFLDREFEQGRHDSTGVFTVDWARARDKFSHHNTGDPRVLILKLVQVMVRCGARDIRFRFGTVPTTELPVAKGGSGVPCSSKWG